MLKKILLVVGVLVVVAAVAVVAMVRELMKTDANMAGVEINPSGFSRALESLADGVYEGGFNPSKFVGATVKVTIKDHAVTGIEIVEHNNMRGKPAEALTSLVVAQQSLEVDFVSGATASSKVILMAIENAVKGEK